MLGRRAVRLVGQHEVDAPLTEQVDRLGAMAIDIVESQIAQKFAQPSAGIVAHDEFRKL